MAKRNWEAIAAAYIEGGIDRTKKAVPTKAVDGVR